ncbi:hypothetical protein BT63DRAFT_421349 [Microthyrium microscopicum]|uniref:Uncharacterized protein n=1 Tax=Microthyrium microscopicum TaxID=703497 RepID=A0A6A6UNY8_9PEZI|nr:hypothetical protein BT63DRAFT_421349 [Microthyrium microscopicum]
MSTTSAALTFLDLPYKVRKAIYIHAAVICCTVSLNGQPDAIESGLPIKESGGFKYVDRANLRFESSVLGPCVRRGVDMKSDCKLDLDTVRSLFHSGRTVSSEAMKIFYSRNKFVVHRCAYNGLKALSRLSPSSLSCLSSVQIELNTSLMTHGWMNEHTLKHRDTFCTCFCNEPVASQNIYQHCICGNSDAALRISTARGKRVLVEFEDLVSTIGPFLKTKNLTLGIICDSEDVATAEAFSEAISRFPRPKDCSIRFSTRSDENIRNVARKTIDKIMGHQPVDLSKLPMELRWKVFENMGLIAPKDVEWKATGLRPGFNLHLDYFQNGHNCKAVKGWNRSRTAFATSCQCWSFPVELFLLNRQFHQAAICMFYRENHFIILPNCGYTLPHNFRDYVLDLEFWTHQPARPYSSFFQHIPSTAGQHLRSVQLVLPMNGEIATEERSNLASLQQGPGLPRSWVRSIGQLNSPNLRLILDFSTLDHRPTREVLPAGGPSQWDVRFSEFTNSVKQAIGKDSKLKAFYIYPPEHIRPLGLELRYEKSISNSDRDDTLKYEYTQETRFMYWYTFVTGWPIRETIFMDIVCGNAW